MYRDPICDRCGTPIRCEDEAQDNLPAFRVDITLMTGERVGLDLHKHCSRLVERDWRATVKHAAANPRPADPGYRPNPT